MKIEKFKRFSIWKWIGLTLIICVICIIISIKGTEAKYRFTASYQAAYGTVHFKSNDLEVLAVNIENDSGEYVTSDSIPTEGYALNKTESYCGLSNGDGTYTKDENITITYVYGSGKVTVSDISKKGTKCFLYFDFNDGITISEMIASYTLDTSRKSGEFTSIFADDTSGIIFEGPADDYGDTTYFFAGAEPDNWVYFAGFYWRIIRVNGNGSLRLIYNGTTTERKGTDTFIGESRFNHSMTDNAYVGYMYGWPEDGYIGGTQENTNSSTVKEVIDKWYLSNLFDYISYLDTDVGFCGDRSINTGNETWNSNDTMLGYEANPTYYGAYGRMYLEGSRRSVVNPIYTCPQENDLYTVSNSSYGNKALNFPVGMITVDEVLFAGEHLGTACSECWLSAGSRQWTMSPGALRETGAAYVYDFGTKIYSLDGYTVTNPFYIKPVINLKSSITFSSGDGTSVSPFVVS